MHVAVPHTKRRVRSLRGLVLLLVTAALVPWSARAIAPADDEVQFAVIGDMGTGHRRQYELGSMMAKVRKRFPFSFVVTVGDNIYGGESPRDFNRKFELPYKELLAEEIPFYASLGNHDSPAQRMYKLFNMDGERYYTFRKGPVQFFALDSSYLTPDQVQWFEQQLDRSNAPWKIAYQHHPIYSSGIRHGPELEMRKILEPLLIKYGVQVFLAGHEHFYERYKPQHGVNHFISGAGGQLRLLNIRKGPDTAAGFDTDNSFLVMRVSDDQLYFECISRHGWVVDAGAIDRKGGVRTMPLTARY